MVPLLKRLVYWLRHFTSWSANTCSKLVKEAKILTSKSSAKQFRKDCHRDIHKLAHRILDEDSHTSTQPSFSQEKAKEYFSNAYSSTPKTFHRPEWMPSCSMPSVPMNTAP